MSEAGGNGKSWFQSIPLWGVLSVVAMFAGGYGTMRTTLATQTRNIERLEDNMAVLTRIVTDHEKQLVQLQTGQGYLIGQVNHSSDMNEQQDVRLRKIEIYVESRR